VCSKGLTFHDKNQESPEKSAQNFEKQNILDQNENSVAQCRTLSISDTYDLWVLIFA
jgi:hypothetical protein